MSGELAAAGFDVGAATMKTTCAFLTPSPAQDGSVLPVPYLCLRRTRRVSAVQAE